jgi:hypothetical protein
MKSDRLNTVFIHIPKCGGTSIETLLFNKDEFKPENFWMGFVEPDSAGGLERLWRRKTPPMMNRYQTGGLQHLTALQLRHALGRKKFSEYYKFAVIRHPVRRSLSQYRYMQKRRDLRHWIGMEASDSFLEYLKKTYCRHHVQWQPQVSFLYDFSGNRLVDDVVRLENIDSDMAVVFQRLNLPAAPIPHARKSGETRAHIVSEDEKDLLWELYADDFQILSYDINKY